MLDYKIYKDNHILFRLIWVFICVLITIYLYFIYKPYISIPQHARYLSKAMHLKYKPSGTVGHALGIIGTIFMFLSYILYFLRKRVEKLEFLGSLSLWLEIHIFFGILGPLLIIFHSAFTFEGIIGIGFWIMLIVVISGIFGRIFFGYCFWGISKVYEPLHVIDVFTEKDLKEAGNTSSIIKRIMDLRPPGFPSSLGLIETVRQWRFIKKETGELLSMINQKYMDTQSTEYNEVHKWGDELIKRLREIRYVSVLDLYLSVLNKWEIIHKVCSYILFFIAFLHIIVTVYWGYIWIL